MLIVRSLDGRATVGLVCFYGLARPPRPPDRGYPGTGRMYEKTINHGDVERVPLSEQHGHGEPTSGHPLIISRRVQARSLTGPLLLY